jgi:hypothetical protein
MGPAEAVSAGALAEAVQTYLAAHPAAALLEDGHLLFDLRGARDSIRTAHGRCQLPLWSEERNLMRSVMTRRMGAAKPQALELVPSSDRRTPTARAAARCTYRRLLERVLTRAFLGSKLVGICCAEPLPMRSSE